MAAAKGVLPEKLLPQAELELPRLAYLDEAIEARGIAIYMVALPHLATGALCMATAGAYLLAEATLDSPGLSMTGVEKRL